MNELFLISIVVCLAAVFFYGGIYLIRNPTFDVELYIREKIQDYIESRTYDNDVHNVQQQNQVAVPPDQIKQQPETVTKIEGNPANEANLESESTIISASDLPPPPIVEGFDPFQLERPGPNICEKFFATCVHLQPAMVKKPLNRYKKERVPLFIPAENATTRLWTGMYWNQWQWAYERWTTLQNVAELKLLEESDEIFSSTVFSLPERLNSKFIADSVKVYDEQFLWDFLNGVRATPPFCRYYKTNYVVLESEAKTEKDTDWKSWLIVDRDMPSNYSEILVPPMLHYLYPGCALQAQYSEYHTVRVLMKGSARYVLISPNQSSKMHLYPYSHPKSRQSQIDWFSDAAKLGDYDDIKNALVDYVDVQPGDVLIVPPGWMIHTEAHNTSLFLDIQSPSLEQVKLLEAMSTRLPFPGSLEKNEKIVYAQVYLAHVLSRIHGLSSIRGYGAKLYNARYSLMFPENSLFMQQQTFQCFADAPDFHKDVVDKMNKIQLQEYAEFVSKRFNDPMISSPLRWLWLGNYVDSILRWTYGGNSYADAAVFLRTCLTMEGKIEVIEEVEGPSVLRFDPKGVR